MFSFQGQAAPRRGAAREGKLLVIPRLRPGANEGVSLQPLCVKCGMPSAGTIQRRFYWHSPWVFLLLLLNVLIYAIVAYATRKRLDLLVPLCAHHRARRRSLIITAWLVALAGIAMPFLFGALGLEMGVGAGLLVLLLLAGGILGAVVSSPITPKRIDESGGTFKGCGEAFLRNSVF